MLNIVKYEFRKQLTSKILILCILAALIVLFVSGRVSGNVDWMIISLVLMGTIGVFAVIYVGIEALLVLNRDLKTKESHMMFMIPYSANTILFAKIIAAILQILLTIILFAVVFYFSFSAYLGQEAGLREVLETLQSVLDSIGMQIPWNLIIFAAIAAFVSWISMIAIGFLSIIVSRTLLAESRLAGLVSVILFFALSWVTSEITQFILSSNKAADEVSLEAILMNSTTWLNIGVQAAISVILLLIAGWMAEKKLSV